MFGPRIRSLNGQVVVLTPDKTGEWYDKVLKFFWRNLSNTADLQPESATAEKVANDMFFIKDLLELVFFIFSGYSIIVQI